MVDLSAVEYNFLKIKRLVGKEVKVLVTVKADAYGHGILEVSLRLASLGVDYLGVASLDEAVALRKSGIKSPILVLGMIFSSQAEAVLEHNLAQTVCSLDVVRALNKAARKLGRKAVVHVKVDTGMGRLGVMWEEAEAFIRKAYFGMPDITIEGIFTHFPSADEDKALTFRQINMFSGLIYRLEKRGIFILFKHTANSMGVLGYPGSHFNLIRPGLIVYGLYPKAGLPVKLKPALTLKSKVVFLKKVKRETPLSYGHTYKAGRDTTIALVPIGYGDGYSRLLSNKADVLIRGRRMPVVGTVCMDQILVDTGDARVKVGDDVILIGAKGKTRISAEEIAGLSNTIPYEVVCKIGQRVPRIYVSS